MTQWLTRQFFFFTFTPHLFLAAKSWAEKKNVVYVIELSFIDRFIASVFDVQYIYGYLLAAASRRCFLFLFLSLPWWNQPNILHMNGLHICLSTWIYCTFSATFHYSPPLPQLSAHHSTLLSPNPAIFHHRTTSFWFSSICHHLFFAYSFCSPWIETQNWL